jgi:ribonuclease VapC
LIDSSAILAIFFREARADALLSAVLEADFAGIGSPTAAETGLVPTSRLQRNRRRGSRSFRSRIFIWQRAIDAYWRFGKGRHPAALNFGDCISYATAAMARQPLLCRGNDFRKTDLDRMTLEP